MTDIWKKTLSLIPKENLIGKEGEGFKIALETLDGGRIGIASQALGIAQASLDASISYSKERIQFNTPISSFQGVQFKAYFKVLVSYVYLLRTPLS